MIHGRRRGELKETLRAMPTLVELGYSVLSISYRNHSGSAMSQDGLYHYGATEWQDVKLGYDFLKEQGFERVVLYGFSMGAAISLELLERLEDKSHIQALILDSPMLDAPTVFLTGARQLGLPDILSNLAITVAGWRIGINWSSLDQRLLASQMTQPILLIGGVRDSTIPISLLDDFASRVKSPLVYKRIDEAEHVESWNLDPQAYATWLTDFLSQYTP
ncbi:MAG: alpha/beta fold hydrolase [Deinococcales bacterium]